MIIFTKVVMDFDGNVLESEFFEYSGPMALCGDAGMVPDMGGVALDTPDGGAEPESTPEVPVGGEPEVPAPSEPSQDEPEGGEPGDTPVAEPEGEPAKPESAKEVLPAALSKAIRELKQAHPEQAQALKALNDSYYAARAYKEVFSSPDEARTIKAALETVGGTEGITRMRGEISEIETFDRMAMEGDPRVIEGLAEEFPDGFKKLVPSAIERLAKSDPAAYREAMRSPLLQMLEGDGLIDVIGAAMEELRSGNPERANRELTRIANWYNQLKEQDKQARSFVPDPRVKELETREQQLRQQQAQMVSNNVSRDLTSYLQSTMRPGITQVLQGKTISDGGRARFEKNVQQEIVEVLRADPHYGSSLRDLISNGKVDEAVRFAKPFIDKARRSAITKVYTELFGNTPAAPAKPKPAAPANGTKPAPVQASNKPVPISRKPTPDDIDWSKDPKGTMFITGKGYLKSGKFVTWLPSAQR